jgi:TonB family protein
MSKKSLFNVALPFFLLAVLFAATGYAQADSCSVKLKITRNNSDMVISGATATAVNEETKKVYKSVPKGGMPYFTELPEGGYRVTVTRVGYKRSAENFLLDCSVIENNEDAWAIELYKGSPKQIVKLYEIIPPRRIDVKTVVGDSSRIVTSDEIPPPRSNEVQTVGTLPVPKTVSGGVVNSKATNLVKPAYPAAARAVRASGAVNVQVTIDENGTVISASAVSGHPLLRQAAEQAARASKFATTYLSGKPVKVVGVIVYNFVP